MARAVQGAAVSILNTAIPESPSPICRNWCASAIRTPRIEQSATYRCVPAHAANEAGRPLQPFSRGPLSSVDSGAFADPARDNTFIPFQEVQEEFAAPDASSDAAADREAEDDGLLLDQTTEDDSFTVPTSLGDLDPLREELAASNRYARSAAACLKSMAYLAKVLPHSQLMKLHKDPLMRDVMDVMDKHMYQFTAKHLVSCLWSMAYLQYVPGSVMSKVVKAVEAQIDDFDGVQLVNVMWSFGKLQINPGFAVVQRICDRLAVMLVDLSPQGLSNVAWACARMRMDTPIIGAVAAESVSRLDSFTPQGVSNLCWALAKLGVNSDPPVLAALEQHAISHFPDYGGQAISMTLWGLARQGHKPSGLLQLVFSEIRNCCIQFSPDCIAAVMCAFAELQVKDTDVITAVTTRCIDNLDQYENKPHLLCSILWAVAALDAPGKKSFAKVVLPAIKPHTKRLSAAHVSNLLYAMGKVKVQTSGAFPLRITQAVIQTAPFMTAKQLSSAATGAASWPLSRDLVVRIMRALKPEVLDRIKHHEIQVAEVLHVMEAFRSKRMFRPGFATFALAYIMQKMRAGEHTRLDVAHTAHIIGEWRAGFRREGNDPLHPILGELVAVIEMRSAEYLKVDQFSARQIATVMWMFGRLTTPPESMELRNLLSSYICNHHGRCNSLDMANFAYSFVAMEYDPGLLTLDAIARHVNDRYTEYGPVEMAQVLYSFAYFGFHPGAVLGRVSVVYRRRPELFDKSARRLIQYALSSLDKQAMVSAPLASYEFDQGSSSAVGLNGNSARNSAAMSQTAVPHEIKS